MTKKKTKKVYVYTDMDHDEVKVFSTMVKAKKYAETEWDYEHISPGFKWIVDEGPDGRVLSDNNYVSITTCKIN